MLSAPARSRLAGQGKGGVDALLDLPLGAGPDIAGLVLLRELPHATLRTHMQTLVLRWETRRQMVFLAGLAGLALHEIDSAEKSPAELHQVVSRIIEDGSGELIHAFVDAIEQRLDLLGDWVRLDGVAERQVLAAMRLERENPTASAALRRLVGRIEERRRMVFQHSVAAMIARLEAQSDEGLDPNSLAGALWFQRRDGHPELTRMLLEALDRNAHRPAWRMARLSFGFDLVDAGEFEVWGELADRLVDGVSDSDRRVADHASFLAVILIERKCLDTVDLRSRLTEALARATHLLDEDEIADATRLKQLLDQTGNGPRS